MGGGGGVGVGGGSAVSSKPQLFMHFLLNGMGVTKLYRNATYCTPVHIIRECVV